ncbi:hypothetical protein IMSAG250_01144 [Clostridiales bacterium]|nr:hypothetical protein IMSAG250_01144 [Clostridiales bacterium]
MDNQDKRLIGSCITEIKNIFSDIECEFPLDKDILEKLQDLCDKIQANGDDFELFRYRSITDNLWSQLLEKAIKCLRYFDKREPFLTDDKKNKSPKAYGIKDLKSYYEKYSDFERVLYGTGKYYRDHVIHVFRTWITGIWLLTKNGGEYLNKVSIFENNYTADLNNAEKISIWTLIALTHDLGYPLEKSKEVIDVTQKMVATFVSNPDINIDFSFHGVQNYMNDFVVRLMSSKMRIKDNTEANQDDNGNNIYVARLQPKYYFKFQKSLEKNSHGILSTIIIYKLLTYFLESDYNINEDYTFEEEDCRQFYIRREILRSIASHTCDDVYQLYMGSFAFLLRICDDTQEWGRKNISELYIKSEQSYELKDISLEFKPEEENNICTIDEIIEISNSLPKDSVIHLIKRVKEQSLTYVTIFRDGQDTIKRDFSFVKKLLIKYNNIEIKLTLDVPKNDSSKLEGTVNYTSTGSVNKEFGPESFKLMHLIPEKFELRDASSKFVSKDAPEKWREGSFILSLTD